MKTLLIIALTVIVAPSVVVALHITLLSLASIFYRAPRARRGGATRILVIIPAKDEAMVIADTLASLGRSLRDGDIVLVVADRCSDDTAAIARAHGARVLERHDGDTPGRAAAIADGLELASSWDWDAVSTIDADSIVDDGFFDALDASFSAGAMAVQPRSEHVRGKGILARLSEVAFSLHGVSFPRGRTTLGIGVRLRGSGMAMQRSIVERFPFSATGVSEDMFYSLDLVLDDIEAVHQDDARLRSLSAPSLRAGGVQRVRWEVGRMTAARRYAGRLVRHGSRTALELALFLVTPPFAVAVFLLVVGALGAWLIGATVLAIVATICIGLLAIDVAIALVESRAPLATWGALIAAPFYIVWKTLLQIKAIRGLETADEAYEPTVRG